MVPLHSDLHGISLIHLWGPLSGMSQAKFIELTNCDFRRRFIAILQTPSPLGLQSLTYVLWIYSVHAKIGSFEKKKSTHQPLVNLMRFRDCVHSDQKLPDQLRLIRRPKSGHVDGENGLISKRFFWQFVFWNSFCQTFLLLKAIAILELDFPLYSNYIPSILQWYSHDI